MANVSRAVDILFLKVLFSPLTAIAIKEVLTVFLSLIHIGYNTIEKLFYIL